MLVVDDDAELRVVCSEYLRLQGFRVLEAKDGLEALLQVKRERPNAIVDLTPSGHQPMCDGDGRDWITYNGN